MAWPTLLDCRLRELLAHWQIITESESIKEPRGRSRSQSYSQIALLHSHLFLHDQLTFADISGTDTRPPRLVRESSQTPVFEEAEIVAFLDSISLNSLKEIRDKAILCVLLYSWCRVSALINLSVADYYERGGARWLRFEEKRGKDHEVPVHSKAKEAVDLWLERSYLASNPSVPLFPSFGKNRETIELRRLDRRSVLKLVEKRAKESGILKRVCCHSFRATGVTEYMNSGGTIEIAQRIAGHTSPSTKASVRRNVTFDPILKPEPTPPNA